MCLSAWCTDDTQFAFGKDRQGAVECAFKGIIFDRGDTGEHGLLQLKESTRVKREP
jgi:hypothetical protein